MTLVRAALTALLVALVAVGGTWVVQGVDESVRRDRAETSAARALAPATRVEPVVVLRDWDARRTTAWGRADTTALAALYAPDSAPGRRDVAMLRAYVRRGLVVEGLATQVLEVRVVRRGDEVLVLDVTDRVSGGTVVGPGVRRALPGDGVSRRRVELRRLAADWVVVEVQDRSVAAKAG